MPVCPDRMCFLLVDMKRTGPKAGPNIFGLKAGGFPYFFRDSSTATARSTVIPGGACADETLLTSTTHQRCPVCFYDSGIISLMDMLSM